jgi:hypothetical protein
VRVRAPKKEAPPFETTTYSWDIGLHAN